ncbi:hypothetical protein VOLCADRAFT_92728 [Volvox carteri f. nagariensis]|uniref:Ion transport domain-containing protein n=1 Tax=Volvox carteri f. nagariensis TaxID=3068 RepID=D8U0D4_VOLCA|nr:uncharacterized protein VOLCADRAFT_92728 [Volvox carteri f. nagariensis]EFJ46923.1 hypothetical protein VOLCADRAFT_92728 [Volvox carteri f. nagariensis]|eukprot:XP_002952132.1 hypothetical protein VOLCADRAFT_92728 [Volvox carteri f. nagariensis]
MTPSYNRNAETADVELSQWQVLQEKMNTCSTEPVLPDAEVNKLLKTIFTDHVLADHPDFVKYFKNQHRGRPREDHLLRKAAVASAAAAQQYPNPFQHQQQPPGPTHKNSNPLLQTLRWVLHMWHLSLARYRAWRPRVQLYLLLSCPEYSPLAMAISLFMIAAIVLNTITFCLESVPSVERDTEVYDRLILIDYVCLGLFTVEFVVRFLTCNSFTRFAFKLMNWVDLAAIAPFLVELAVAGPDNEQNASQTRIFRLIRLIRILRLLRASSRFRNLQLVVDALSASLDVIGMLVVVLGVLLVVAGTVVYYVEGALVKDTWFDSIPLTMYYMHVTFTTTGYGEYYAQSTWGRLVVGVFMLLCMVTVSLPIGVVGGNFSTLWTRYVGLRDAIGRSLEAWGTRAKLRGLAAKHCTAVDELVTTALRLKNTALLAALRESLSDMGSRLGEAGDRLGHLQALLSLVPRVSSSDVTASLEGLHAVHQGIAQRATEGVQQASRTRQVLADLRAMREVLKAEEDEMYGTYEGSYREEEEGGVDGMKGRANQ